ncbi:DUF6087 family protein [Streptomyces sp. NPDC003758]
MADEEPLHEWAARRDRRRAAQRQITGTRRAVPSPTEPAPPMSPPTPRAP